MIGPMLDVPEDALTIDVVSDVMCPWCYIGKRRLDRARELVPEVPVDVRWRPFQLDAGIPPEGMDRQEYLDLKFGRDRSQEIYARIEAAGEAEGINFAFDRIEKSPNTLDAHRLIRWAVSAGCQEQVVERLFSLYFVEGEDVGDKEVLVAAARDSGMDGDLVRELLDSDADKDRVEHEVNLAHQLGVEGVPAFIFGSRYIVLGAQAPELLAKAILRANEERHSEASL